MKIGVVLHPYGEDKPAGLGRAIFEITRSLIELDEKNEYLVILRKRPRLLPEFSGKNWKIKIANYKYFWLDRALLGERLDVCVFNTPVISFFVRPQKSVVIAYDFAYDDFDPSRLLKFYHGFSLRAADLIISISKATKREIIKLFNISAEKIKVVYLGYADICENAPSIPERIPEKYFIFVGAIKARKNVLGIIKAFQTAKKEKNMEHKLIISGSGKGEYYDGVLNYVKKSGLLSEVIFLGHTTDNELSYLYKNATALLYPSFIEGFGFPILEAMACGLPVVTSTSSSLPELAGDSAILVDPNDIEEIKRAIINLSSNSQLREGLKKRGSEQVKKFSWNKTAKEILALI